MRYRRGDAYASSQVFYERINSQLTTTVFDYTRFGVIDASKRLVHLEKHPATKIHFTRKFSFSCRAAEESYRHQRTEFLDEHRRTDDYLEFTEGLDLLNVRFQDHVTALSNPHRRPWYLHTWAFWTASALLLSYPFRLLVGARTAHVHYTVHKIFGVDRGPEFVTRILVPDPVATVNRSGELETAIRHNLSLAPSYAEAIQQIRRQTAAAPSRVLRLDVADFRNHGGGSIPLVSLGDRNFSADQKTHKNSQRESLTAEDDDARYPKTSSSSPSSRAAGSGNRSGGGHVTTHRNSVLAQVESETPDAGHRTGGQRSAVGRRQPTEGESDCRDDGAAACDSLSSGVAVSGSRRFPVQLPSGDDDDDDCRVRRTGSGVGGGRISGENRRESENRDANGDRKNQVTSEDGFPQVETGIKRIASVPLSGKKFDASKMQEQSGFRGGGEDEEDIVASSSSFKGPSGERPSSTSAAPPVSVSIRVNPFEYLTTPVRSYSSPERSSVVVSGEQTVAAPDAETPPSPDNTRRPGKTSSAADIAALPSPPLERRSHGANDSAEASDNSRAAEEEERGRKEAERESPGALNFVSEFPPSYEDALRMRPFVVEPQQQQLHGSDMDECLADSSDDSPPGQCDDNGRSRSRTAMIIEIIETSL